MRNQIVLIISTIDTISLHLPIMVTVVSYCCNIFLHFSVNFHFFTQQGIISQKKLLLVNVIVSIIRYLEKSFIT